MSEDMTATEWVEFILSAIVVLFFCVVFVIGLAAIAGWHDSAEIPTTDVVQDCFTFEEGWDLQAFGDNIYFCKYEKTAVFQMCVPTPVPCADE